jgi:3-deoxy-manno-octulosonate cytidylyltransferase (CMP-KDO synthetase)
LKTLAVLPARYASTRFPGKPLALIGGKPMIQWVWEAAMGARADKVVVATDDERIASAVKGFGGQAIFTDPSLPSGTDRAAAAMDMLGGEGGEKFDIVLNIQGDEPAMHFETIESVIALMANRPDLPMGTAACPFQSPEEIFDPNVVKVVVDDQNRALYFSRSPMPYLRASNWSDADLASRVPANQLPLFRKHLGIYAYRPDILKRFTAMPPHPLEQAEMLEQLRALAAGIAIGVAETPHGSLGVDTPGDIAKAEGILLARGSGSHT